MELDNIEKLLKKYFEAETSLTEEAVLKRYFSQKNVAPHLKEYAVLFQYLTEAKEERYNRKLKWPSRSGYIKWISVAAAIAMAFGIFIRNEWQEKQSAIYAYAETQKALSLLAENLERGTKKVAYLQEFEIMKQKIYNYE